MHTNILFLLIFLIVELTLAGRLPTEQDDVPIKDEDIRNEELLLEIMIRIAANPKSWNKILNLLPKISNENSINLTTEKSLLKKLSSNELSHDKISDVGKIRKAYPKTFKYEKIVGRPLFKNKNSNAYVAVSIIAPKYSDSKNEDFLEKQIKSLKPWTHEENLKNMETLRRSWIVKNDK